MLKRLAILGAVAVALAAAPAAQAAPFLVGGVSFSSVSSGGAGPVVPVDTDGDAVPTYTDATALDFTTTGDPTPGVVGLFNVDGTSGDFDLLAGLGGTLKDFTFSGAGSTNYPAAPVTGFQVITAPVFSFDLLTVGITTQSIGLLSLEGTGLFHLEGYADTPGTFIFTSQTAGQGTFSFSASQATTPVPEPLSLMLLGSGLLGLAAVRRRTMR